MDKADQIYRDKENWEKGNWEVLLSPPRLSGHHGVPAAGPPQTTRHAIAVMHEGCQGGPNQVPMMPRGGRVYGFLGEKFRAAEVN